MEEMTELFDNDPASQSLHSKLIIIQHQNNVKMNMVQFEFYCKPVLRSISDLLNPDDYDFCQASL